MWVSARTSALTPASAWGCVAGPARPGAPQGAAAREATRERPACRAGAWARPVATPTRLGPTRLGPTRLGPTRLGPTRLGPDRSGRAARPTTHRGRPGLRPTGGRTAGRPPRRQGR